MNIKALHLLILGLCTPLLLAEPEKHEQRAEEKLTTIEVEVKPMNPKALNGGLKDIPDADRPLRKVELEFVTYSHDKSLFVGYYQDGWFEMVSLHEAKTKRQIGQTYCDGGVPRVFRFSKDRKFLGGKASVGWYVWKIPSFERVLTLGDIDFDQAIETKEEPAQK